MGLERVTAASWHFALPISLPSMANERLHWAKRAKRTAAHRGAARAAGRSACAAQMGQTAPEWLASVAGVGEVVVTLTRQAPRKLDDDNLRAAFKGIRDGIADALGIDDRDARVRWEYAQATGRAAVVVEVTDWVASAATPTP